MKKNQFLCVAAFCCAMLYTSLSARGGPLTFGSDNISYGNGAGPEYIIPVDINNNLRPGVVCANFGFEFIGSINQGGGLGDTLCVFTNDGAGNLSSNETITVGNSPEGMASADFNGDGYADIICANTGEGTVTVITNNRAGGFAVSATISVGVNPVSLAAVDVNGDGKIDFAVANYNDDTIYIFTNTGTGTFVQSSTINTGPGPDKVLAADFNGDGKYDLACLEAGPETFPPYTNQMFSIYTNDGKGSFEKHGSFPLTGMGALSLFAANGDGKVDLAAITNGVVVVLTNDGFANFKVASATVVPNAGSIAAGDFNGDGKQDLACVGNNNGIRGSVTVLLNNGRGNLTTNVTEQVGLVGTSGNYPNTVVAADFNGDGNEDMAVTLFGSSAVDEFLQENVTKKPIVGITVPAEDAVLSASDNFSMSVDISSALPIETVFYYIDGVEVAHSTSSPFTAINTKTLSPGSHGLQAVVTDSQGNIAYSREIQINISGNASTALPKVTVTSPASGATISSSATMKVTATAPSGEIIELVNFYADSTSNLLAQFTSSSGSYSCPIYAQNFSPGTHTLFAYALDSAGITGTSAPVSITVKGTGTNTPPKIAITSPANGAVLSTSQNFVINATASAPAGGLIDIVNFFWDETNFIGSAFQAPWILDVPAGTIPAGNHVIGAFTVDSYGVHAASAPVHVTMKTTPSPLAISITNPTNGQPFTTTNTILVKSAVRTGSSQSIDVLLYADGTNINISTVAPYSFTLPSGLFTAGDHTLQEILSTELGAATSAVTHITINAPGTSLIDFDALNTTAGAVSGTTLSGYLASYGVTLSNVTTGTTLEAVNQSNFTGNVQATPSSKPNLFTQAGANGPMSFTLVFQQPLKSVQFTRVALTAPSTGLVTHPAWSATAFDANGDELSSVSEGLIATNASAIPARMFILQGNGIASVTFSSDSENVAAFPAVLLDNLFLDQNPTTSLLSVSLSVANPPTNSIIAPANITLNATVNDAVTTSFSVSYYAGLNLLGTVSSYPYTFVWTNVLPGHYDLRASVFDSSGLSARSASVPIVVKLGPDSTVVDFEGLPTRKGPLQGTPVRQYLSEFGIGVASISPGTFLAVERQRLIAGGDALNASSGSNVLTQIGSNGPVQFTLNFTNQLLSQFGFTRPELLANPFVSFPGWQATAYDAAGAVVEEITSPEIDSSVDVGAERFSLQSQPGGPGIAKVQFQSEGTGLNTFNAVALDDLVLTTNPEPFAPAVAITRPLNGKVLTKPPLVTIVADASAAPGSVNGSNIIGVSFYANGNLIDTAFSTPFKTDWVPGGKVPARYDLTAVALADSGLAWTSAPVTVIIRQPATQFGILSAPANQTVGAGGSASFTVVPTGTNGVTYQWSANNGNFIGNLTDDGHFSGSQSPTLTINPPISDGDAGTYAVTVTSGGQSISASAILTVIDPPVFDLQPQGQTVPNGTTVTMAPSAPGTLTWQWLLNGVPIPGATNRVYSILAAQALQSGNYQVVAANQLASAVSDVAPVLVSAAFNLPFTNDDFANAAVINPLLGPVAASNVLATTEPGEPAPVPGKAASKSIWFSWKPNFTGTVSLTTEGSDFDTTMAVYTGTKLSALKPIASDDDSGGFLTSLVTFNVTAGTTYIIAVDGFQGASGRVVLGFPAGDSYRILNPSSGDSIPAIVRQPVSRAVAPNSTVTLSVAATSVSKLSYQWNFNGSPIAGATGSSLTIKNFQAAAVGMYSVIVANQTGSVLSEPANLQIVNDQGTTPTLTENKLINTNPGMFQTRAAINLTPLAVGGDTRGFTVSQVFSTVGSTAEPGEPEPCGQVPSASQWFVYQAQVDGELEVDTIGSHYNTLMGVYTGNGSSFADLTEVGCGYVTNFAIEAQPEVLIPGVEKGETFYIVIDGFEGATGVAQLHIGLGTPLILSNMPAAVLATAGSNVTLRVNLQGGSIPGSYDWQLNGADLPGGTKSTYTITNAQDDAVGNYSVIVSNVVGVATSSPPTALSLQYAPLIVSQPVNETVALGKPAKFSVTAIGVNVKTNAFAAQWYMAGGGAVPKATGLTLSFPSTLWAENGSYYVVISNSYGSVTSTPAALTITDTIPPTIAIKSPANNSTVETNVITVTGTASDKSGIQEVILQVNGGLFQIATGSNNWAASVRLGNTGLNTITAQSVDYAGNASSVATVKINYKPAAAAQIVATTADQRAQTAGTYGGLFYPTTGVNQKNAGYFGATIAGREGVFSANITIDDKSFPFAGQFDAAGDSQNVVARFGQTPLTAILKVNGEQMTGLISNVDWVAPLQAVRNDPGTTDIGGRFMVMDGATRVGYFDVSKAAGATANVSGALPGGSSFVRSTAMSAGAIAPLYVPLYSGQGAFLGWFSLAGSSTNSGLWIKPRSGEAISVRIVRQ